MSWILGIFFSAKVSENVFLQNCDDHCIIPSDITKFQTLQRVLSIPTFFAGVVLSRHLQISQ